LSSILKSNRVHVKPALALLKDRLAVQPLCPVELDPDDDELVAPEPEPDPQALIDAARARGYDEGFVLGRAEGLAQAQQEMASLLLTARTALDEVTRWKQQQLNQELPSVVGLAMAIAERVVRRAVELDPEVVLRTLEEAARQREAKDLVRIAVNPEQVEAVRAYWTQNHPSQSDVEIGPDPGIEPGGCLLFSQSSLIDALLQTQLDVIARELHARRV
jgi:flagellar assembly protein FliH